MKRKVPRHGKLRAEMDRKKFRKQLDKALTFLNANALEEVRAFQKAIQYGKPGEECVRLAQDFLDGFADVIMKDEGVSLVTYLEGGDAFDVGVAAMQRRDWETAIRHFQRSQELTPRHAQIPGNIGLCYLQLGCKQHAIDAFDRALAIDPGYQLARLNRRMAASLKEGEIPSQQDIPVVDYYGETFKKTQQE